MHWLTGQSAFLKQTSPFSAYSTAGYRQQKQKLIVESEVWAWKEMSKSIHYFHRIYSLQVIAPKLQGILYEARYDGSIIHFARLFLL